MINSVTEYAKWFASNKSVERITLYGLILRLVALIYAITHDHYVDHIKYTDIDYHVFTNGSQAIIDNRSPFEDTEYRYSPIVALIFVPNILLNHHYGKLLLIIVDILCSQIIYRLNIHQGTNRQNSKLFLILWLFNPMTIAISTRGSFEPIITLLVLLAIYLLINDNLILSGLIYGLSIHVKLYPVIYAVTFYGYMIQRKPYLITQSKPYYWLKTFSPTFSHIKFFLATLISALTSSYICYIYYGHEYLEQSFIYHMKRKDLQHNFSIYFYLFRIFPNCRDELSIIAFLAQFLSVAYISISYLAIDTNRRVKLRKLSFSLFGTTFLFVALNKVCTSQYFNWYLIFVPLILDSVKLETNRAYSLLAMWILSQVNWLLFAYLYEYQGYDIIDIVGNSSLLFLVSNLWIMTTLCKNFNVSPKSSAKED